MSRSLSVTPSVVLHVTRGVTAREFDGEWIILDLNGGSYFGLDRIGGAAWTQFSEGKTIREAAEALAAQFDVEQDRVLHDLLHLANELVERKLLTREGDEHL